MGLLQYRIRQNILFSLQSYKRVRNSKVLQHHRQRDTLEAFVYEGFNNWKKALSAFDRHEKIRIRSVFTSANTQTKKRYCRETVTHTENGSNERK